MLPVRQSTCQLSFACCLLLVLIVACIAVLDTSMSTLTCYVWPATADRVKL